MLHPFPKIFSLGTIYIKNIFKNEVECSEKIDGSQFVWGKINGELQMRSKGQIVYYETVNKMFKPAVDYIYSIQDKIPDNTIFYCETLSKLKHNVIAYNRVPKHNLALFGVSDTNASFISEYDKLRAFAEQIDIECVPLLFKGKVENMEQLTKLLETESVLGGSKIEGVVCKNYAQPFLLGGQPIPLMCGKLVSEKFKEKSGSWGKEHTGKGKWQTYKESFRTEARWDKAILHLSEKNELEHAPRDIGKLIKEIHRDITEECKDDIKEFLWRQFGQELIRQSAAGFAEYYKKKITTICFDK